MKKLNFLNKLIYIINTFAALLLLFSYLLPYISPKSIPFFAILSLLVPALIIVNLVFTFYWLIKLKKQWMLSAVILIIGFYLNSSLIKFSAKNIDSNNALKVMSYNVRMFNHWKWIDNDSIDKNIFNFIKHEHPDIIAFQEYYTQDKNEFNYNYSFVKNRTDNGKVGLAILSKFPIIHKGSLELENTSNNIIYADILRNKDTIRVYNLHLQSLELNPSKENFGQKNSEKVITRLKQRFKQQAEQAEIFLEHQSKWKGKIIVAGDFNNTSYSWVYKKISKNKKDAFIEAGKGFGKTFNYWFPLRIDFILTDKNANIEGFKTFYKEENSDHYPILTKVSW